MKQEWGQKYILLLMEIELAIERKKKDRAISVCMWMSDNENDTRSTVLH